MPTMHSMPTNRLCFKASLSGIVLTLPLLNWQHPRSTPWVNLRNRDTYSLTMVLFPLVGTACQFHICVFLKKSCQIRLLHSRCFQARLHEFLSC
jgi:hypothetical protein